LDKSLSVTGSDNASSFIFINPTSHGVLKLKVHLYYFGICSKGQQDIQQMSSFSLKT